MFFLQFVTVSITVNFVHKNTVWPGYCQSYSYRAKEVHYPTYCFTILLSHCFLTNTSGQNVQVIQKPVVMILIDNYSV